MKGKPKKIFSFTLSKESIEKLEKVSKALGLSRSELVERMIKKLQFTKEIETQLNKISKLQEEVKKEIKSMGMI